MNHWHRRMVRSLILTLLSLPLLAACSTYTIRRYGPGPDGGAAGYQRVPGVPFYNKRAVCRQETVYQQDLVRLTFRVYRVSYSAETGLESAAVLVYASERLVDRATAGLPVVARLRQQPATEANWRSMVEAFELLPQPDLTRWQDTAALALVSNATAPFLYVDYDNQYYLDVERPLQGSSSATAKLAPDGTLTEVAAQTEDTTLGTIVGAIPFSGLIGEAFGLDDKGEQRGQQPPFRTKLDAAAVPILHKLSTWRSDDPMPCWTSNPPITPRSDNHGYTYARVIAESAAATAKTDENAIAVTGRISLPTKP